MIRSLRKYLAAIPLLANILLVYLIMPQIMASPNKDWASSAILIISFFSIVSTANLGLPMLVIRAVAGDMGLGARFQWLIWINSVLALMLSAGFIVLSNPSLTWVICFAPLVILVNLRRGFWEAAGAFIRSYTARMVFLTVYPLLIIFRPMSAPFDKIWLVLLVGLSLFLFLIFFRGTKAALKNSNSIDGVDFKWYFPFLMQFIASFLFIFSDRYIAASIMEAKTLAFFIKEFEQIYRLSAPMFLLGSLIFPALSAIEGTIVREGLREMAVLWALWIGVSVFAPGILSWGYEWAGFVAEATLFGEQWLMISIALAGIGTSILLQRIILALGTQKQIMKIFALTSLTVTMLGIFFTMRFESAAITLMVKSVVDVLLLSGISVNLIRDLGKYSGMEK